jgi:hypothetical protein
MQLIRKSQAMLIYMALFLCQYECVFAGTGWTGHDLMKMGQASARVLARKSEGNDIRDAGLIAGYCLGVSECLPNDLKGATVGQLVASVVTFLRKHPNRLNDNSAVLVADAIQESWPAQK